MSARNRITELEQRVAPRRPRREPSLLERIQGNVPEAKAASELAHLANAKGGEAWSEFLEFWREHPEPFETCQDVLALAREFFNQPPASPGTGVTL